MHPPARLVELHTRYLGIASEFVLHLLHKQIWLVYFNFLRYTQCVMTAAKLAHIVTGRWRTHDSRQGA